MELTLNEVESNLSLKDKKSGFELIEPNAIVKYLAKDFTTTEAIKFEEQVLYSAIKSNKKMNLPKLRICQSLLKEELTPSQIIVFASLYPAFKDTKENEWFSKFSQLPEVATGIKNALAITPVERKGNQHWEAKC